MEPALEMIQGLARSFTAGDRSQNVSHGGIGGDEAFTPTTEQEHLEPGLLLSRESPLFKFAQEQAELFGQTERGLHGDWNGFLRAAPEDECE